MYNSFFPQFAASNRRHPREEIQVAGDWAYAWGSEKFVLAPKAGGPAIQAEGKGMSLLRRQPDRRASDAQ
jgi:hypothetical protein